MKICSWDGTVVVSSGGCSVAEAGLGVCPGLFLSFGAGVADVLFFFLYREFVFVMGKWGACPAGHVDSALIVLFERVRLFKVLFVCDVAILSLHDWHS